MGFIPGALVQVIPEPGGLIFTLYNENISSYSELDTVTQAHGGKLMQVSYTDDWKYPNPVLTISGQVISNAGLDLGANLIIHYTPGTIRVRKCSGVAKIVHVTSDKNQYTGNPYPKLQLFGTWLTELGFMLNASATTLSEPGRITLQLRDEGAEKYADLVRFARQNNMKLAQVREKNISGKVYPYITIPVSNIDKAGLTSGDTLLVSCAYGFINLRKFDFDNPGF
jgi:hypothetical protein